MKTIMLLLVILSLALSACGGESPTPTVVINTTPIDGGVTDMPVPPAATTAPTDTTAPAAAPTNTEAPTAAPVTATATQQPAQSRGTGGAVTASSLVAAFKAAGLEAESPNKMGPKDYGAAPFVGEGIHFLTPSVCADCGGRVVTFKSADDPDLASLKDYYESLGKKSAMLFSWVFVKDNALLQLNGDMKEGQARKYEKMLNDTAK